MKKKIICTLSIILLINNIFAYTVFASPYSDYKQSVNDSYNKANNNTLTYNDIVNTFKFGMGLYGFITDFSGYTIGTLANALRNFSIGHSGGHAFEIPNNASDTQVIEEASKYIYNNTEFNDNDQSITYNSDSRAMYNYIQNNFINDTEFYVGYTYIYDNINSITIDNTKYQSIKSIIDNNIDGNYCVYTVNTSGFYFLDKESTKFVYKEGPYSNGNYKVDAKCNGYFYYDFVGSTVSEKYVNSTATSLNDVFVAGGLRTNVSGSSGAYLISERLESVLIYPTVSDAQSYYSPYYYNNDVYSDYSSSSVSSNYVFSPTNINTVTYGDIASYADDYNETNNNYPDYSTVNNWIENTNTENITNNGGGTGGENGGGDSGGGSSGDGIFDFLSDLGGVLGNLIKNLGQAITNIIAGIADLVESIVTDLPTVFFDFIGAIFGWLPEEWVTLLSLSLACMLIWGIVKVIRG